MKRSSCSVDGCNNPAWAKGLCVSHIKRKPLARVGTTIRAQQRSLVEKVNAEAMRNFFMEIWKERIHESEVSGEYLGKEALSTFFHHILPKNKYPELAYEKSNIILLTLEEHTNVENDMYRYPEVNVRREQLLNKINQ